MAGGGGGERKSVLVVMESSNKAYLVFHINMKDLLQCRPRPERERQMEMRTLPSPAGEIPKLVGQMERIDFTLTVGGATMVGVSSQRRTVTYDTRSGLVSSAGPELQHHKMGGSYVVPIGRRIYALQRHHGVFAQAQQPSGEVCAARLTQEWRSLPEPPPDFRCVSSHLPTCQLTAYLAAGTSLWVSAKDRGTYSLDTAWRKDGDWELPFCGRGVFVPDLDGLCFGHCFQRRRLLAVDMDQSPPAVRYRWEDTFPRWVLDNHTGDLCGLMPESSLVYLGAGRFCIAWTVVMHDADDYSLKRRLIHVMALQLLKTSTSSGHKELRLIKHKVCCYRMPSHGQMAYLL
ncbi:hypothetical protein BRADI_1g56530v3 [Brachypodium distachyon]|uniref:DUF1618 domain-containing protein n=1 Tax=Brachypodium distachyon TaxID=15368 RepID=A0A0Q3K8E3_BRADI|nr:hypothetical protein BRADI_1g56530v3 [Brachypodium distachyon]